MGTTSCLSFLAAIAILAPVAGAATTYNDLSGALTVPGGKFVTGFTAGQSGDLRDFDNGTTVAQLAVTGGSGPAGGNNAPVGTDAYSAFNGIVNLTGAMYNPTGTLTFSGLDGANYTYDVVVMTDRSSTTNQWVTSLTIGGADAFTNTSSTGSFDAFTSSGSTTTTYQTFTAPTEATTLLPINNSRLYTGADGPGYVARWSGIAPGADNTFTVSWANHIGTNGYVNAVRLISSPVPEPASLALLSLGALALMRRRS